MPMRASQSGQRRLVWPSKSTGGALPKPSRQSLVLLWKTGLPHRQPSGPAMVARNLSSAET